MGSEPASRATKGQRYESDTSSSEQGCTTKVSEHNVSNFACSVMHDSSNYEE